MVLYIIISIKKEGHIRNDVDRFRAHDRQLTKAT